MKLSEFLSNVATTRPVGVRVGQHFFNCLPLGIADRVRGTDVDPFYDDSKIDSLIEWLLLNGADELYGVDDD